MTHQPVTLTHPVAAVILGNRVRHRAVGRQLQIGRDPSCELISAAPLASRIPATVPADAPGHAGPDNLDSANGALSETGRVSSWMLEAATCRLKLGRALPRTASIGVAPGTQPATGGQVVCQGLGRYRTSANHRQLTVRAALSHAAELHQLSGPAQLLVVITVMAQLGCCSGLIVITDRDVVGSLAVIVPTRWGVAKSASPIDLKGLNPQLPTDSPGGHSMGAWWRAVAARLSSGVVSRSLIVVRLSRRLATT